MARLDQGKGTPSAAANVQYFKEMNSKMKNFLVLAIIATFVSLIPITLSAQIVNGGFEDGDPVASGAFAVYFAGDSGLTGWTVGGPGGIEVVDAGYWAASAGNRSVDLSGWGNVGSLSQSIATIPGLTYTVSFDMSGNPEGPLYGLFYDPIKSLVVTADGGQSATFSYDTSTEGNTSFQTGSGTSDMMYSAKAYTFVASGTTTDLMFTSENANGFGPVLDNVSITEVTAQVCHRNNGASARKTLIVGTAAVAAHLAHGDTAGACPAQ
jgi:choice-of-anchor C domain-containing protein